MATSLVSAENTRTCGLRRWTRRKDVSELAECEWNGVLIGNILRVAVQENGRRVFQAF